MLLFTCSVVSDSCDPIGLQHTRLSSPSLSPGVFSNICIELLMASNLLILCQPLLLLPSSFPASGSFPTSQFFASGGQSIGASASASVLPMIIQDCFPLGLPGLISLQSKGLSSLQPSPAPQFKSINSSVLSLIYGPDLTSIHDYWKNHTFDQMDLCRQTHVFVF